MIRDEQGKKIHQDINVMEEWSQRRGQNNNGWLLLEIKMGEIIHKNEIIELLSIFEFQSIIDLYIFRISEVLFYPKIVFKL